MFHRLCLVNLRVMPLILGPTVLTAILLVTLNTTKCLHRNSTKKKKGSISIRRHPLLKTFESCFELLQLLSEFFILVKIPDFLPQFQLGILMQIYK